MSSVSRRAFLGAVAMSSFAADYRIVDPHVHVWKHDPEFPFAREARPPARDATPEMLVDLMKANGVSKTVIIQVIHYRYDNSYLAGVLQRYPQYFQGVCRLRVGPRRDVTLHLVHAKHFRLVERQPAAIDFDRLQFHLRAVGIARMSRLQ